MMNRPSERCNLLAKTMSFRKRPIMNWTIPCILLLTGILHAQRIPGVQVKELKEPAAAVHAVEVLWGPAFSAEALDSLAPGSLPGT